MLTAESVGDCWLSLHVQLRYIFITLQYLNIEIDKSELSVPPSPPWPALLSPSTRSAHAVNVNARDYSNRWITGTISPHFFSFLHFVWATKVPKYLSMTLYLKKLIEPVLLNTVAKSIASEWAIPWQLSTKLISHHCQVSTGKLYCLPASFNISKAPFTFQIIPLTLTRRAPPVLKRGLVLLTARPVNKREILCPSIGFLSSHSKSAFTCPGTKTLKYLACFYRYRGKKLLNF